MIRKLCWAGLIPSRLQSQGDQGGRISDDVVDTQYEHRRGVVMEIRKLLFYKSYMFGLELY